MSSAPDEPDVDAPGTDDGGLRADELSALRALVEGTAQAIGDDFFRALVRNLCIATGTFSAFVAIFSGSPTRARTLAYYTDGHIADNFEWDLAGTPCEDVVQGRLCHHPSGVASRYPREVGIESYLGVPLVDSSGEIIGHLAILDTRPMSAEPRLLLLFRIFAARAAAELERARIATQLRQSEERFRDLFAEAPIAYVHEDLESRFIRANRTAMQVLGITPEEVPGMIGLSLVPDTPEAQRRVHDALESVKQGIDINGVTLELRRKDTQEPLFIQWWSRPDPSGEFTRTMFIDITERVLLERERSRLEAHNEYLRHEIKQLHDFDQIIGASSPICAVLDKVQRVAPTDATVLVRGETGTGKELIARAIHSHSRRRDKPLIKVNCAALPASLIESELFGHERGAFTGALARRAGRFELAHGGTLFLDEIGEMPLEIQAKLLRVLQEQEFERVGGSETIKVDVRVIAATNRDLNQAVADKTFREDLYYRLNVIPVQLPPLRERMADMPLLVQHLVEKFAVRIGRAVEGISEEAMQRLCTYHWPGNIRELENVLERALILSDSRVLEIDREMLPETAATVAPLMLTAQGDSLREVDRSHILVMLERTHWTIEGPHGAARLLDMAPSTLRYRMKKLGIAPPATP